VWLPTTIVTREATLASTSSEQGRPRVVQLFVDDVLFARLDASGWRAMSAAD
jgi:hypothetical protein